MGQGRLCITWLNKRIKPFIVLQGIHNCHSIIKTRVLNSITANMLLLSPKSEHKAKTIGCYFSESRAGRLKNCFCFQGDDQMPVVKARFCPFT
jgi:hypothetical protein